MGELKANERGANERGRMNGDAASFSCGIGLGHGAIVCLYAPPRSEGIREGIRGRSSISQRRLLLAQEGIRKG
jgi:hypothetical protein